MSLIFQTQQARRDISAKKQAARRCAVFALFAGLLAAGMLALSESRAQVPPDLIPFPDTPAGYNPADPRFSGSQLCGDLGGEILNPGESPAVCAGLDKNRTFCFAGSPGAFPCRGLYKHVILCNGAYNRPALNPFFCGQRCGPEQKARGEKCETVVRPRDILSPAARAVASAPEQDALVITQGDALYTLALPEKLNYQGREFRNTRIARAEEDELPAESVVNTVFAKIGCAECYPDAVTIRAELFPVQDPFSTVTATVMTTVMATVMVTIAAEPATVMVTTMVTLSPMTTTIMSEVTLFSTVMVTVMSESRVVVVDRHITVDVDSARQKTVTTRATMISYISDEGVGDIYTAAQMDEHAAVGRMLDYGIGVNEKQNGAGWTPLHAAAFGGALRTAMLLLSRGADARIIVINGETALHAAAEGPNSGGRVIATLLAAGAEIDRKDGAARNENTPLLIAAQNNKRLQAGLSLAAAGANVNLTNSLGRTALHEAVQRSGLLPLVTVLIEKNANLEAKDNNDYTPLHWAVGAGNKPAVKLLLDSGAIVNAQTKDNHTPFDIAVQFDFFIGIDQLLLDNGGRCNTVSPGPLNKCPE